ncbi:MAG: type I restriction enzyme HsdR N-terminal domain-containing protein [Bacteroidetes bacterium]|nr:type I restriction enzyme HsdR N-terminal domain-containing protein [Bacteroidota bacterium]
MQTLNLPEPVLRIRNKGFKKEVFDSVRRRFVALTPEEWVRQHFIHYLVELRNVPLSLIAVEAPVRYNSLKKRGDIVVYGKDGSPCLIVECKAPKVAVTQAVFDQAAMYNVSLKVPYLAVTNGMEHFACYIDHGTGKILFLKEIPMFEDLVKRENS